MPDFRDLLNDLPDERPSAAWRAGLDARVAKLARRRRLMKWSFTIGPTLAFAGALAMVLLQMDRGATRYADPARSPGFEAALVATHDEIAATPALLDREEPPEAALLSGEEFDADGS